MNPPKIECVIRIEGDVWYEEKTPYRKKKLKLKESKSIKRGKNLLRLNKIHMERIKPVCDRQRCYENCIKKRLLKKTKDAKNRKQKDSKLKIKNNKKHVTRNKKSGPKQKKSVRGKPKTGKVTTDKKRCNRKTKHKKKRPAPLKIKTDQNVSHQTTSTGSNYIEGLSPISCEESLELCYDSISSESFAEDEIELRLKAKERTKKRSKRAKTLEPATERRYSSPNLEPAAEALRSSTPSYAEDNATVFSSEMDVSIHSLATVVMSPRIDSSLYSPNTSPSELVPTFNKWHENVSDDDVKTAVKIEPYNYKGNDWFAMSCHLDTRVKTEIEYENEFDFNAGHKSIKSEPNNNDSVFSPTSCLNKKNYLDRDTFVIKKEKHCLD